jgi:hypothetical protein
MKRVPPEAISDLHRRLSPLTPRSAERRLLVAEAARLYEVVAAIKVRTSNKKGRHLSTAEAIRLLEDYGVQTPDGPVRAAKDVLTKTTVNRYL